MFFKGEYVDLRCKFHMHKPSSKNFSMLTAMAISNPVHTKGLKRYTFVIWFFSVLKKKSL